jgi:hypothetical protein
MKTHRPFRLSFEIECHKLQDQSEFCRVFFKPAPRFPRHLLFGLDAAHFDLYRFFTKKHSGLVVSRYDKLTIYVRNKRTRTTSRLDIDLEPYWPAELNPGEVKVKLSEIDLTAAIGDSILD